VLHGTWFTDGTLVTSDRRLKKHITDLTEKLRPIMKEKTPKRTESIQAKDSPASWLLRQLRPVSYRLRKGVDSKYTRFGFIADELEEVIPQVVRNVGNTAEMPDQKAVAYSDLIAVLAAALQEQSKKSLEQSKKSLEQQKAMEQEMEDLRQRLKKVEHNPLDEGRYQVNSLMNLDYHTKENLEHSLLTDMEKRIKENGERQARLQQQMEERWERKIAKAMAAPTTTYASNQRVADLEQRVMDMLRREKGTVKRDAGYATAPKVGQKEMAASPAKKTLDQRMGDLEQKVTDLLRLVEGTVRSDTGFDAATKVDQKVKLDVRTSDQKSRMRQLVLKQMNLAQERQR